MRARRDHVRRFPTQPATIASLLDLSPEFFAKSDIFAEGEFDRAVELDVLAAQRRGHGRRRARISQTWIGVDAFYPARELVHFVRKVANLSNQGSRHRLSVKRQMPAFGKFTQVIDVLPFRRSIDAFEATNESVDVVRHKSQSDKLALGALYSTARDVFLECSIASHSEINMIPDHTPHEPCRENRASCRHKPRHERFASAQQTAYEFRRVPSAFPVKGGDIRGDHKQRNYNKDRRGDR